MNIGPERNKWINLEWTGIGADEMDSSKTETLPLDDLISASTSEGDAKIHYVSNIGRDLLPGESPSLEFSHERAAYFNYNFINFTLPPNHFVATKIREEFNATFYNISSQDIFNTSFNQTIEEGFGPLSISDISLVGVFCILIVLTVIGNTLVILAVLTTRRLRTVTNCFVTSLAVADWLVGICVMPPAVALHLMGTWSLGWILCDIWISMDVMLCTASILSLCAISVDRYLAVTQPLKYSRRRRSKRLALLMILGVWAVAIAITSPPMLGWYEIERKECRYNQNPGYVVFSAMGSFFIPMVVMLYVYLRISCVVARRHQQLASTTIKGPKKFSRWTCLRAESEISESFNQPQNSTNQNHTAQASDSGQATNSPASANKQSSSQQPFEVMQTRQCCYSCENIKKKHTHRSASSINKTSTNFQIQTDGEELKLKRSATVTYKTGKSSRVSIRSKQHFVNEHEHLNNRVSSLRRETKTAQTLSIVVGGFIACWLPFFIYYLITPFLPKEYVNPAVMSFLTWLGWFNSAINPFIYAFYSPDFRIAFWRLTVKRCSRSTRRADFAFHHK